MTLIQYQINADDKIYKIQNICYKWTKKLNILIENKCFTLINKMFKYILSIAFYCKICFIYIYIFFLKTFKYNVLKTWPIFVFEKDRMAWWTKRHLVFSDWKDFCKNKVSLPKIMHVDQISRYVLAQKPRSNETNMPFVLHTPFSVFSDWHGTFFKLRTCYRSKSFSSSFVAFVDHFWWLLKKKKKLEVLFKFQ